MIKIVSGYSDKGGSTTVFINLTNFFNENGIETVFYGPNKWHLDKCKSADLKDLKITEEDNVIAHFMKLDERPPAKKIVLSCHEKWWYPVGRVTQFWDEAIFLHEEHRKYHSEYTGKYQIIPNIKEPLKLSDKSNVKNIAGIIGTIEDRKQTHLSIQQALRDKCDKIYIFGNIGNQLYYETFVKPLLIPNKVIHIDYTTDKQSMYNMIGKVYHNSKAEVACLVKDECYLTGTEFIGNEETNNIVSTLTNEEILFLWKKLFNI
jgi:hypothetical protein